MRNFWALPAVLRIALASRQAFSVFDDLLAFPQYEVQWSDTFLFEEEATSLLSEHASPSTSSVTPESQETQDLSKHAEPSAEEPQTHGAVEETYEAVVLGGQRYICSLPTISEEGQKNNTASAEQSKADEEKELARAADRGWQLLEGMRGNCIYYISGWWSYSFCYTDEVKQFHQLPPSRGVPMYPPVEDTSVHSFILGRYPKEDKPKKGQPRKTLGSDENEQDSFDDEGNKQEKEQKGLEIPRLETKGSTRYMVQQLTGGTVCDLTGKPRKIDVQFHCNPQSADRIAMIKETSTCSYLMVIDTPRLCNDVAFLPPQENAANPIVCQPVIADSEAGKWEIARIESRIKEAEGLLAERDAINNNPIRDVLEGAEGSTKRGPIIGDIEVGAQALVGTEGKVIEKTVVVGGGKETFVGTVADSSGKVMSKEEMKKLNTEPKKVEELIKNLKKLAGKQAWKLDLVDTPRGREFRGIIEAEDQGEDQEKGDEKRDGMSSGKKKKAEKKDEREEADGEEGSEEVYKDEL